MKLTNRRCAIFREPTSNEIICNWPNSSCCINTHCSGLWQSIWGHVWNCNSTKPNIIFFSKIGFLIIPSSTSKTDQTRMRSVQQSHSLTRLPRKLLALTTSNIFPDIATIGQWSNFLQKGTFSISLWFIVFNFGISKSLYSVNSSFSQIKKVLKSFDFKVFLSLKIQWHEFYWLVIPYVFNCTSSVRDLDDFLFTVSANNTLNAFKLIRGHSIQKFELEYNEFI